MAKIITKAVTRLQKFLAAIAGDATAPTPVTNQEKLLFNIAEEMKAASASELPVVGASDKDKYLHTNARTGEVEWSEVSGGGAEEIVYYLKQTDFNDGNVIKFYKDSSATTEFSYTDFDTLKTKVSNGAKILFKVVNSIGYINPTFVQIVGGGSTWWYVRAGILYMNNSSSSMQEVFLHWGYDNT